MSGFALQRRMDGLRAVLRAWGRTGRVTPVLVAVLCLLLVGAAWERGRGNIHKLSNVVSPEDPLEAQRAVSPGPGGQAPVRLSRTATAIGGGPEFVSATLLPGRGMNVYQITAIVPGHGEVKLLVSPPEQSAESVLTGRGDDADGAASTTLGGAFLLPWAGVLTGTPVGTGGLLRTAWEGAAIVVPARGAGMTEVEGGLLLNQAAASVRTEQKADGQATEAVFLPGSFGPPGGFVPAGNAGQPGNAGLSGNIGGAWPSDAQVVVRGELAAHTLELTVTAKNVGDRPMPFGIGWRPYFAIASGDREGASLRLPPAMVVARDERTRLPTGRLVSEDESLGDRLRTSDFDRTYTELKARAGESGPIVELRDPAYNLGLRLVPESATIRFLHVIAPADQRWVTIEPNMNGDDPLGAEWGGLDRSGMVRLMPGESVQWKVRLELFALSAEERP